MIDIVPILPCYCLVMCGICGTAYDTII